MDGGGRVGRAAPVDGRIDRGDLWVRDDLDVAAPSAVQAQVALLLAQWPEDGTLAEEPHRGERNLRGGRSLTPGTSAGSRPRAPAGGASARGRRRSPQGFHRRRRSGDTERRWAPGCG